jgi:hypothetical protein
VRTGRKVKSDCDYDSERVEFVKGLFALENDCAESR